MKINEVKQAAEKIREDLKLAAKRQEQEHDADMENQAKSKDGISIEKSQQLVTEIEDILDIEEIKERLKQIEACEPL
jgi:hypothetical protein